jgi:hypothetical protein
MRVNVRPTQPERLLALQLQRAVLKADVTGLAAACETPPL